MPPRVRCATADVPTVQEMANRIVETLAMHERLVLEEDGSLTGYAYAHRSIHVLPTGARARRRGRPPRPIAT
jgi:hypothetical protein